MIRQAIKYGEVPERQLPCDAEAERNLLGSIMLSQSVLDDLGEVEPHHFSEDRHAIIFRHLRGAGEAGEDFDPTALRDRLLKSGELEAIGGTAYLGQLMHEVPHHAHASHYARLVLEKFRYRAMIGALTNATNQAYAQAKPPEEIIGTVERQLRQLGHGGCQTLVPADQAVRRALDRLEQMQQHGGGLPTGLIEFDRQVGGLFPGELIVLAARPGNGKTSLAMQIAIDAAQAGVRGLIVSMEMGADELMLRVLGGRAERGCLRSSSSVATGGGSISDAANSLAQLPLFIEESPRINARKVRQLGRQLKREGLGLCVVDYLGLMAPDDPGLKRYEQLGQLTRDLKETARELRVPLLLCAQLNREAEAGRPKLSHLRESGNIEADADVVLFIHREDLLKPDDPDLRGCAELIVAKNRNGPSGMFKLLWDERRMAFVDRAPARHGFVDEWNSASTF